VSVPNSVSPRLFKNSFLETLSRVRPWVPILLWGPVVFALVYFGRPGDLGAGLATLLGLAGLFTWTLTEYGLHRFLFHWNARGALARRFVFLLHGVHHEYPNDPDRLLMPPAPGILFAALFGGLFRIVLGAHWFPPFFAGFLIGYLIYDYAHFASHYSDIFGRVFPAQKRRHMIHHFVKPDRAYGVSSPLWDWVFRTI
jgi:sterol desaturase/sphingolipid hydroxylase (fatty acid hydroxylase superfamily)